MKKTILLTVISLLCIVSTDSLAQKVKKIDGSISMLSGQSKINVVYDYSEMRVGKFDKEGDYIAKKTKDYNEKEAGRGDKWAKSWVDDRANRFQPQFEELFNKYSGKTLVSSDDAKYTLIVKTVRTEPGFNVHVMRKNAEIDAEVYVVETANKDKKLATIKVTRAPGRSFGGYDYDSGTRLQEAYATAGKGLGKYFKKELK